MTPSVARPRGVAGPAKRALDLALVFLALPVALPTVLGAAIAIRVESKGSPFFVQQRVGTGRRAFRVYKLRTMVENACDMGAGLYCEDNDPRFTRVGRFLRRSSIDELPQLLNILRGEMSIVGPRPALPVVVNQYATAYDSILQVLPGLTGLAQVSGRNSLTRSERLQLDARYAAERSLALDLKIIAKTLIVAISGSGQRNDQSEEEVEQ